MVLGQQHGVAGAGQGVGGRHAAQPAADHDDVVMVTEVLQRSDGGPIHERTTVSGGGAGIIGTRHARNKHAHMLNHPLGVCYSS